MSRINVAIDGPAGAGKSTIAKNISKALGIIYLDTGAMYRTVALKALKTGVDTGDHVKLAELVNNIDIRIIHEENEQKIFLDGIDVSREIRSPEVTRGASDVAVVPAVRLRMVELQREIAANNDVVMDGRDIGTYVLPDARFKFFLTASLEERAKRRYEEQLEKGMAGISLEDVVKDISYRDQNDSTRAFAPLSKAEDAVEIDTTGLAIEEVTGKLMAYIGKENKK